jgi:Ca-activated chloride channel homolog
MSFLSPLMLLFGLTIPVVIILYLLKLRRHVKVVPSSLLWQKFLIDSRANAPFQKLRRNLLLFLQILILLLAVLALARPFFKSSAQPSRFRIVLLDASASMQSTDVLPNRFEAAKSEALDLVNNLRDQGQKENDLMMVILMANSPQVICPATSSKEQLRAAIRNAEPQDTTASFDDAWKLAVSLARNQPDSEAHLFSDGALAFSNDLPTHLPLHFHPIGSRCKNVGITSLEVRRISQSRGEIEIFLAVQNASETEMECDAELYLDDQVLAVRPLKLQPLEEQSLIVPFQNSTGGLIKVALKVQDDLAVDNHAVVVSQPVRKPKALLVSNGNSFLERAIATQRDVELTKISPSKFDPAASGYDIIILDEIHPATLPAGNLLMISSTCKDFIDAAGAEENPVINDMKLGHPLTRFINLDNVQISRTLKTKTPKWAIPIVESPSGPLIFAGQDGPQKVVWIGFSILDSNWPLRVSFPIFISNTLQWLDPASDQDRTLQIRTGEPARLPFLKYAKDYEVKTPDGKKLTLELPPKAHEAVVTQTDRVGTYEVKIGEQQIRFCANLLDSQETMNKPKETIVLGKYQTVEGKTLRTSNYEMWRWLALAAFGILLGEWWYFHRISA